jgi:hypothetical protein
MRCPVLRLPVLGLLLVAGLAAVPAAAETPEEKGLRIAQAAESRGEGYQWSTASGRMILRSASGSSSERQFVTKAIEAGDGEDRGMLIFTYPPDIAKTALLTIGNKDADDDQWLYLPALKRVKRISAGGKTGSFVGSEFSFEDLSAPTIEDYTHTWLGEAPCPGQETLVCDIMERRPLDEDSGYTRIVSWQDQVEYRSHYTEFYDRKNALLKVLQTYDYALYKERFWRASRLVMTNVVSGKSTEMLWESFDFDTPMALEDFTTRALERLQ